MKSYLLLQAILHWLIINDYYYEVGEIKETSNGGYIRIINFKHKVTETKMQLEINPNYNLVLWFTEGDEKWGITTFHEFQSILHKKFSL